MPTMRSSSRLSVALLLAPPAGCQTMANDEGVKRGICRPDAAEALAGESRISDKAAMRLTGATIVRQIRPGDPVTMDLRQERVTIETDPATGKIVRAMCG